MRFVSTRVHGILDYLTVVTLLAVPRWLNWDARLVSAGTVLSVVLLTYSLATRYEMGAWRLIPLKVHLALDATAGLLIASAPFWMLRAADNPVGSILMGFGTFEVITAMATCSLPSFVIGGEARGGAGRTAGSLQGR